jgi:hypothetical protein
MTQVTLDIQDSKLNFFLELIKNFDFVKVKDEPTIDGKKLTREQIEFVNGLREALNDVELHMQGKKKLKTIDQLLDEL